MLPLIFNDYIWFLYKSPTAHRRHPAASLSGGPTLGRCLHAIGRLKSCGCARRRLSPDASRHAAFVPVGPAVVNPPKVLLTAEHRQASAGGRGAPSPPRMLDALRRAIRVRHCSIRAEEADGDWARRFVRFHERRHLRELGAPASSRRAGASGPGLKTTPPPQPFPVPR